MQSKSEKTLIVYDPVSRSVLMRDKQIYLHTLVGDSAQSLVTSAYVASRPLLIQKSTRDPKFLILDYPGTRYVVYSLLPYEQIAKEYTLGVPTSTKYKSLLQHVKQYYYLYLQNAPHGIVYLVKYRSNTGRIIRRNTVRVFVK